MKKITLLIFCVEMIFSLCCIGCGQKADDLMLPSDYQGEIVIAIPEGLEDEMVSMVEIFNQEYPNITVQTRTIDFLFLTDCLLVPEMTAGQGPDVLWANDQILPLVKDLNWFEDLSVAPYNFDSTIVIEYLSKFLHDDQDRLVGLPMSYTATIYAYRRDMVKHYLGASGSTEVAAMFPGWDTFIDAGEQVLTESNGDISLFSDARSLCEDIWASNQNPWLLDGELLFQENYMDEIDLIRRVLEAGLAPTENGTEEFMNNENTVMNSLQNQSALFYRADIWLAMLIAKYAPKTADQWAYILPPVPTRTQPHLRNGIEHFLHINKNSANKEAAYQFIQYLCGSEEGNLARFDRNGTMPVLKSLYEENHLPEECTYLRLL